jgi:hypothetical protein
LKQAFRVVLAVIGRIAVARAALPAKATAARAAPTEPAARRIGHTIIARTAFKNKPAQRAAAPPGARSLAATRRLHRACIQGLAVLALCMPLRAAWSQGGPPLVTDDPDTPGDGRWEINLATTGARTAGRWEIAAPDADINYGWGEHVQLKLELPWTFVRESGQAWQSGLGAGDVGVKWRFVDSEDAGFSMSTYPQYVWSWLTSSERRGITDSQRQFFLPVEAATVVGEYELDGEIGRNFVAGGTNPANQWQAGFVVGHVCAAQVECVGEVHETVAAHTAQTLLNLGVHWKLSESLILLASVGRQFGPRTDDQQRALFYLGVQLLR